MSVVFPAHFECLSLFHRSWLGVYFCFWTAPMFYKTQCCHQSGEWVIPGGNSCVIVGVRSLSEWVLNRLVCSTGTWVWSCSGSTSSVIWRSRVKPSTGSCCSLRGSETERPSTGVCWGACWACSLTCRYLTVEHHCIITTRIQTLVNESVRSLGFHLCPVEKWGYGYVVGDDLTCELSVLCWKMDLMKPVLSVVDRFIKILLSSAFWKKLIACTLQRDRGWCRRERWFMCSWCSVTLCF